MKNSVTAKDSKAWVARPVLRPEAEFRLFCFPYAGGGASNFLGWTKHLASNIELCAVLLPGREIRLNEPPITDMRTLLSALMPAVLDLMDRPFAFFGHSLGALIAFEATRWLRQYGHAQPDRLLVSGLGAPQLPKTQTEFHTLADGELVEQLRKLGATPDAVIADAELLSLVLSAVRADFAMFERYTYRVESPIDCPITVFGGDADRETPVLSLAAWQHQTRADVKIRLFSGGHFFINGSKTEFPKTLDEECQACVCDMRTADIRSVSAAR